MRRRVAPAKVKSRAKRPAGGSARKSPKRLPPKRPTVGKPQKDASSRLRDLERNLAEALEQQTATSEILRVISRSPGDVQPVLDTIARSAARLCGGEFCHLFRFDGKLLHFAAHHGLTADAFEIGRRLYPMPPGRDTAAARSILSGTVEEIPDVRADHEYSHSSFAKAVNYRSIVAVPMLHNGVPIGAIAVARARKGRFPQRQIALFKTFADQAVIAIENARLFNETKEALDQQTATAEILRAISSSPGNLQPVLDTLVRAAAKFCGAPDVVILRLDDRVLRGAAGVGQFAEVLAHRHGSIDAVEIPVTKGSVSGRAVLERRTIHIHDLATEAEKEYPEGRELQRRYGHRTLVVTPLLREGVPIGVIGLFRNEVRPFSDKQLQLLRVFADQAVIAIENVRLFHELEVRNRDLTEALEQQTATSEILRVISQSPTDVQPVFDTIAERAATLCGALFAFVTSFDGEWIHMRATHGPGAEEHRSRYPIRPGPGVIAARVIRDRATVQIEDMLADREYEHKEAAKRLGFRSGLGVPMMRDGLVLGSIVVARPEAGAVPESLVRLLETFADQAVIAIENVRLFTELEARNRDLTEALEQQTATSEILRVISRSPTDVQPVFETIADAALNLCRASTATVFTFDGELTHLASIASLDPEEAAALRKFFPRPPSRDTAATRAILTRGMVAIPDVLDDPDYKIGPTAAATGFRSALSVPLLRDGNPIGAIGVGRSEPGPFPDKQLQLLRVFADQAVIAIENVRLFHELEVRNRDLTEALERQTATSEILRVISQSPRDVKPVFDTIAAAAQKLCRASAGLVFTFDGELIHLAAEANLEPQAADAWRKYFPRPPSRDTAATRAILTGHVAAVPDALEDPEYVIATTAAATGFRSALAVPLIRNGKPIGAVGVGRSEAGAFPESQIALLQTFADQAVIAIENVRLFTELEARNHDLTEALERQTATSEILRVISSSPNDVRPVFETIVACAARLCSAESSAAYRFEGEMAYFVAGHNFSRETLEAYGRMFPCPLRETDHLQRIVDGSVLNIPDIETDPHTSSRVAGAYRTRGVHSSVFVPMVREGRAIGAIGVSHRDVAAFSSERVELLKTFADQAVIAIENVRLFKELEARNHDLTEALEHQTATSEILRVISSSPTDVQPVFEVIGERAEKLCDAQISVVSRVEGEEIHLAALHGVAGEGREAIKRYFPMPVNAETVTARAIRARDVVHVPDYLADPTLRKDAALAGGYRACLAVPMAREGHIIGAIFVARTRAGRFADSKVELLKTFADQAVIAIENVRLFTELGIRNRDLIEALEQQTATSEILRVISQSPTDVQPVFDTIAAAALKLCRATSAVVTRFDGELIRVAGLANVTPEGAEAVRGRYPRAPGRYNAAGRAILTRSLVAIPDVLEDPEYEVRAPLIDAGFRSVAAIPLLREGSPLGAIGVVRPVPGAFPEKQIALLQTFADQAVIAIENVRLFNETKEALEHQKASAEVLGVISSSVADTKPVFDKILESCERLFEGHRVGMSLLGEDNLVHLGGYRGPGGEAFAKTFPYSLGLDSATGTSILERRLIHFADVQTDQGVPEKMRTAGRLTNTKSQVLAPMIWKDRAIGSIFVGRPVVRPFSEKEIALLKTFADQAVIAIENVRLFSELDARTAQLTRSVGELKALGEVGQAVSSTLDLETVLSTIVSRAVQLAGMDGGSIWEYDEEREEFHLRATDRLPDELVEALRATPIRRGEGAVGRMAVTGEPVEIRDVGDERAYQSRVREAILRCGYRSVLTVPLLRENHLLGALAVNLKTPGEFPPETIDLMKTFATQSALAIQNARLFREIEDKSRQLEVASRHKSEFLANMSHELRTPLNAIIGFSEVLSERMFGEVNDKQAEYLGDIQESGRHLLSLINDILDLSKIEAGRMELEPSEFDLPSAIENTLILVRERAQRRGITLGRTLDERLGAIRADERKVKQVLLNLLSNALKFTPEGGRIDVRAKMEDSVAEISVTDTGVGIAPEDQEAVFEEFRQVGTASKKVEGTGLGLAISKKIIELHGGRIWVESQVGSGSSFTFTLPLADGGHRPAA